MTRVVDTFALTGKRAPVTGGNRGIGYALTQGLAEAGASMQDVVRTRIYLVDAADFDAIGAVHGERFAAVRPANTTVVVAALLDARWRVEIEAEAVMAAAGG